MTVKRHPVVVPAGHLRTNKLYCSGCGLCEIACALHHDRVCQPASARLYIEKDHLNLRFLPHVCAQCRHPACQEACPLEAVRIDERTGARYIDPERCNGCGECAVACPLMPGAEVLKKRLISGRVVYVKCDLCRGRENGPVCVEICPRDAITYHQRKTS